MRQPLLFAAIPVLAISVAAPRLWAAGEDADFLRAQHLYALHEYKLAAEAFNKYLAGFPKSERSEQARLLLAESEYQLKDYTAARGDLDKFLADYPSSTRRADALQRAVKVHWYLKDFAKSVECAEIFLKENRERLKQSDAPPALHALFEQVLYYAGDSSYGLKKNDQARAYWEQLQKEFPKSAFYPDASEGLGWIAFDSKNFDEAMRNFQITAQASTQTDQGAREHPKAAESQLMVARALDQAGKAPDALGAIDKVAAMAGGKDQAREVALWRATILLHAKRYPDAVAAFKQLIQAYPEHPDTPLAVLQAVTQLEEQSLNAELLDICELYLTALPKAADRPLVTRIKTRALIALKKNDAALTAAQAALKEAEALPPNSPEYQEQRPAALILLAELSGAAGMTMYEAIAKDHAASRFALPARYQIAFLLSQSGKLPEALAQTKELLKQLDESAAAVPAAQQTERAELLRKTLFAAADYSFRGNAFDQAEIYLKRYAELPTVKADPANMQMPLVSLRLAWCRHHSSDFTGAVEALDKALAANPPADIRPEMLYLRGRARLDALAKAGGAGADSPEPAKALADYTALVKDAPTSSFATHANLEAGQLLFKLKPADALPWLDKVIDTQGAEPQLLCDALLLRARTRYTVGKPADALADVESLLKRTEKTKEHTTAALVVKGLSLEALPGKEADAAKAYGELINAGAAAAPEVRIALLRRGKLRFNAKQYAEAMADLATYIGSKDAKTYDATDLEAAVLAASCKKELKDTAGAQADLEKIAALQLTGAAAFEVPFQLGNSAYEAGKHADAAAQYRRALDAAAQIKDIPLPALSAAWLNMAWCYRRANELRKADNAFEELIKLDPQGPFSAEARFWRGRTLAELSNTEGAVALWKEILDKQSDSSFADKALAAIGETQLKAGRTADATKSYEEYIAKHPKGEFVREALCGLAECQLRDKKPDAARETYLKCLGDKGVDADLDDTNERAIAGLAQLAMDGKKFEDAKKLALRIVIDRGESKLLDQALMLCGKVSEEMKEPAQAIGYYRKLLSDRPKSDLTASAKERLQALGAQSGN